MHHLHKHLHIHPAVKLPKRRTKTKLFDDKATSVHEAPVLLSKNILWVRRVWAFPPLSLFLLLFLTLYLMHLSPKVLMTNFNSPASSHSKVFSVMKLQSSVSIDPTSFRYHQNTLFEHISCCFCYVLLFNASILCSSNKREAIREALLKQKLLFFSSRSVKFLGKKSSLKGQGPIKQHVDWQACWEEEGVKGFFLAQSYHSVALKARQRSMRQTLSWHGF